METLTEPKQMSEPCKPPTKFPLHINLRLIILTLAALALLGVFIEQNVSKVQPPTSTTETVEALSAQASAKLARPIFFIDFNAPKALSEWKSYALTNRSKYEIAKDENGRGVLRATSHGTSSAIFKVVNISSQEGPVIVWEWKVTKFPAGRKNQVFGESSDSDYAARVTAVFGKHNPLATEMIQYVWDDHFPEGTHGTSSFSKTTKIYVVRSGPAKSKDGWLTERRNLVKDYELLFEKPLSNNLRGISIMTDSDDTKSETEAFFRSVGVERSSGVRATKPVKKKRIHIQSLVQNLVQNFFDLRKKLW